MMRPLWAEGDLWLNARIGGMVAPGKATTLRLLATPGHRLRVELATDLAASPKSLGLSQDERRLGV